MCATITASYRSGKNSSLQGCRFWDVSIFLQRIRFSVGCVTDMMYLRCALPSSACSHYCSRVARLDGQSIPPLNSDCNGGVDCVGERMVGGEGEVVLGCEAELVDELLRVLTDASCGLHGEGNEVSELSGSDFLVLDLLGSGRLLSDCENCPLLLPQRSSSPREITLTHSRTQHRITLHYHGFLCFVCH